MTTQSVEKTQAERVQQEEPTRTGQFFRPDVDIIEQPGELLVLADMPGVGSEDVDIQFENGTLTIHGRVRGRGPQAGDYLLREYGIGDFFRTFRVSEHIDVEKISAELGDGVLRLHLPKVEAIRPRKITVKAEG